MPRCRSPAAPLQSPRGRSPFAGDDLDQRRALLCLTQAVYYEAGFEPLEGRRAVAQVVLNRMRHPAFPKSVCGVVYQGAGPPSASSPSSATARSIARPAPAPGAQAEEIAARRARRLCRDVGRRGDPLSRRLCRAALGADARQGRADRRSTSSIAGPAPGASRPRSPAAISASRAIRCRCARRCRPGCRSRHDRRPAGRRRRPVRRSRARRQRRRRPARHVEGLDAQHPGPGRERQRRGQGDRRRSRQAPAPAAKVAAAGAPA